MSELTKTGIVMRGIGGFYTVLAPDGQSYSLRAQGKIRRERLSPLVGDEVDFVPGGEDEEGWLTAIHSRKNALVRPAVANIDEIVLVVAASSPKIDALLIDRLLIAARRAHIAAALAINKSDLDREEAANIAAQYAGAEVPVMIVCAHSGEGIEGLKKHLAGKTHAFGGQSGVGKSSLINALYGLQLETGNVSRKIERGKHTTRRCELIGVEGGGRVLDTPGFSLLETDLIEPRCLADLYPEFAPHTGACRFTPCYHVTENECGVRDALAEGKISSERYERYCLMLDEMKERWKKRYD